MPQGKINDRYRDTRKRERDENFSDVFRFFAAVALSVIDTSSSNFLAENWTQFPNLELNGGITNRHKKKVNSNSAVTTVNSNKETANSASGSMWGPKWIANLTDVIGISHRVLKDQTKRKQISIESLVLHE